MLWSLFPVYKLTLTHQEYSEFRMTFSLQKRKSSIRVEFIYIESNTAQSSDADFDLRVISAIGSKRILTVEIFERIEWKKSCEFKQKSQL